FQKTYIFKNYRLIEFHFMKFSLTLLQINTCCQKEVLFMRNSLKVAKWEIKRNMTNKSFIISLLLTPVLFMVFFFVPSLFSGNDSEEMVNVYVLDKLNVWNDIEKAIEQQELNWVLKKTDIDESAMQEQAAASEQTVYIALTEEGLDQG